MTPGTLLIRADASVSIGTGHVMRCLALAQAWQDQGGRAIFAVSDPPASVCQRLESERIEIWRTKGEPGSAHDARSTTEIARAHDSKWIVVDGYHFGAAYQRELRAAGLRVLFVDDNGHAEFYLADLILNQNIHASENFYKQRDSHTRSLLGPRYCLLRREFEHWNGWKRDVSVLGRKVLVSMGGSDAGNATERVIFALKTIQVQGLDVIVVVGGANPHLDLIESAAHSAGFRVMKDVTDMPKLLAWADVIVAAAGSICWEICAMALPAVLIVTASNQVAVAQCLAELQVAFRLDSGVEGITRELPALLTKLIESRELRQRLSSRAAGLVDTEGSARVVQEILDFA